MLQKPPAMPFDKKSTTFPTSQNTRTDQSNMSDRPGNLIVITGPSGVGKGTLVERVLEQVEGIKRSVSVTTREKRRAEQEGVDYFFRTPEEFQRMIDENTFMEWAEFAGSRYGTPKLWVEQQLALGQDIILEIEVQGAKQVKVRRPESVLIFLSPPSFEELEARLRKRGTESEEKLTLRLRKAKQELGEKELFHYEVVNDIVDRAVNDLVHIVYSERCRIRSVRPNA
jgi:guanylate kinase